MSQKFVLPTFKFSLTKKVSLKKMGHHLKRFFGSTVVMAMLSVLVGFTLVYTKINSNESWGLIGIGKEGVSASVETNAEQAGESKPKDISRIPLLTQNSSNQKGVALVQIQDARAKVVVEINSGPTGVAQPAFISEGSCQTVGAPKFLLENVVNGRSETFLTVSVEDLQSMVPLVIEVRKSVEEFNERISCGELQ